MVAKLARKKRRLALPRTSSERRVWVRVSINGAIFSLILFSLAHLYRGWGVGFVTITLALLYVLTGNLLASMLWHMLFDVRFSFETPTN